MELFPGLSVDDLILIGEDESTKKICWPFYKEYVKGLPYDLHTLLQNKAKLYSTVMTNLSIEYAYILAEIEAKDYQAFMIERLQNQALTLQKGINDVFPC